MCNPNKEILGFVSGISDLVIFPKWGSCSELSFTVYKEVKNKENPCYDKLKKSRLIHVDGFGYFTITEDEEEFEDKVPHKSISAYSAEYSLNQKGINLTFITTAGDINSTTSTTIVTSNYFFYRESQPDKSLLHQLIKVAPQWSIGYVSHSLKDKSRSFSETDKGLYGFLTNEVSQSYEALFVFDNENYVINAYDTTEVVKKTNIVLSFDNLLKNAKVTELSDDIYTVINVSGAENLSIAKINPNGTKKLFCLDYYTGVLDKSASNYYENYNEWITDNALKKKVLEWEKANKEAIYATGAGSYGYWTALQKKFNLLLLTQQAALNQMQTYYDTAQQNMSLWTEYADIDKMMVYVQKRILFGTITVKEGWVEYGQAKSNGWPIVGELETYIGNYVTDSNLNVTRYTYWKNYSYGCETNLNILKTGGKLYSVRAEDFSVTGSLNADYNVVSGSTIVATGEGIAPEVINHSITPSGIYSKYSIDALTKEIEAIQKERDKIVQQYSYDTYFTDEEKLALDPFLIEGSFSDDTFIVTDSMQTKDYSDNSTKIEVIEANGNMVVKTVGELKQDDIIMDDIYVAGQLVDAGYEKLKVVSQPTFSFEAESANFFFIEKFKPFIQQLLSIEEDKGSLFGSILNIQLEDDNWVYPYLQELEINYDNPDSFTMKFGNRFRLSDDVYTFNELHNETTSAVSSVGSLLSSVSQPVTNGTIDAVTEYTKKTLTAANQSIRATTDNDFIFGSYGIKGRKVSTEEGNINGFSPEQLWITNNKICFTDDGWETTKAIFGKFKAFDGSETWGLVAESIVGELIMGNNLIISNSNNTFTVDESGLTITNNNISIKMSPDVGIDVIKKAGSGDLDVFQVDTNGNMTITGGRIVVGDGQSMGYIIDGNNGYIVSILKDSDGNPLFELTKDGHMNVSGLSLSGSEMPPPTDDPIAPSGSDGVVEDSGGGLAGMDWIKGAETLVRFFYAGPYNAIRNACGKTDNDGMRSIWQYYSNRTSAKTIFEHIWNGGYHLATTANIESAVSQAISDNNKNVIEAVYATKASLNDYKTWSATQTELEAYQLKSDMVNYYTSTQVNNNFVRTAFLTQNYYSKSDIQGKFAISDSDKLSWQTVTIGNKSYTILTKT